MKSNGFHIPVLAASVALALSLSSAHAQYSPNFDTFDPYFTLSGQLAGAPVAEQWQTNDISQSDYLGPIDGYRDPSNWALLGGLAVTTPKPYEVTASLWRNFTLPDASFAQFNVDFAITAPTVGHPARDSFAWTFRTNSPTESVPGTAIAGISFKPTNVDTGKLDIYWTNFNGDETLTGWSVGYGAIYSLQANVFDLGGASPYFTATLDPSGPDPKETIISTALNVSTPSGVGEVAVSWTLSDTSGGAPYANYGSNSILFQNYSAIPEPSTWVLFGVGAGALALVRRRKK
ncbi:MAG: PEP-CTERM sorting domain-containing protein [Verrucomicrobiae bacterium]